jgi:hypothetical protein
MADTNASHSWGASLRVSESFAETLTSELQLETPIAEVIDIGGLDVSVGATKATHLLSHGAAHEYICGLIEGGEVQLTLNHTSDQTGALYGILRSRRHWLIEFNDANSLDPADGSKWRFKGFISKIGNSTTEDDKIVTSLTIKVTGKPIFIFAQ